MFRYRSLNPNHQRAQHGIAIGPILFIVAILGILAAAIAAGSGSFTSSTANEGNSTKAAALIQIGSLLRVGADRLQANGYDADTIVADPTSTDGADDLFSPTGGGVSAPGTTMAKTPASDTWRYTHLAVTDAGTTATELVAFLEVTKDVCNQINPKANGVTTDADQLWADIGDLATDPSGASGWPGGLDGKIIGCAKGTGTSAGYFFYQVLVLR